MADGARPVSILGVGFAGFSLAFRHWATAIGVLAGPMAVLGLIWLVVMGSARSHVYPSSTFVLLLVCGLMLIALGVGQLLVYRVELDGLRLRPPAGQSSWMTDLGRILVVTVVWLIAAIVLQVLLNAGMEQTGMDHDSSLYAWLSGVLTAVLLAIPLLVLGLAASASYQQRRWVLFCLPPPWPDLWRLLLGWAVASALVTALWWAVVQGMNWLITQPGRSQLDPGQRVAVQIVGLGLALGMSLLLMVPAWAQAWRQSLGRPVEDPAAVFD